MNRLAVAWHALSHNLMSTGAIALVSEPADWVIKEIAEEIVNGVNAVRPNAAFLVYSPLFLKNKTIHFASVNTLVRNGKIVKTHPSNRKILTWYHVLSNDARLPLMKAINEQVDVVHTACTITARKLEKNGIPANKIVVIPEGISTHLFKKVTEQERAEIRHKLGLPSDRLIIGSFQKDGSGWGEGDEPKLEKGPDIFCAAARELVKRFPIHVLLTGPARGYVKKQLAAAGIPFTHHFLDDYKEIGKYYSALDAYIISSREEGGPRAVLEAMAAGVPLVSTRVGMAPDVIIDGENGFLTDIEAVAQIVEQIARIFTDNTLRAKLIANGLKTAARYDNRAIAEEYITKLYGRLSR